MNAENWVNQSEVSALNLAQPSNTIVPNTNESGTSSSGGLDSNWSQPLAPLGVSSTMGDTSLNQLSSTAAGAETLTLTSPSNNSQLLLGNTENTQLLSSGSQDGLAQQTTTSSARLRSTSTLRTFAASTALVAPSPIRVEAETLQLNTYRTEASTLASGGSLIGLKGGATNEVGTASGTFRGASGTYNIKIGYFDEADGTARIETRIGTNLVATTTLNQQLGGSVMTSGNRVERIVASGVTVQQGDRFELRGLENAEEHARIDYIEFIPVTTSAPAPATTPIRVEAEQMGTRSVYRIEASSLASNGNLVSLKDGATGEVGRVSDTFRGPSGNYDVVLRYVDENDGTARVETRIGDRSIATTSFGQQLGSNAITSGNMVRRVVASNVSIQQGERIELIGTENQGEFARLDYIEFVPVSGSSTPPTPPADTTAPTAALTASNITATSSTAKTFTVTYRDNAGIDASTIDSADVRVTGPNGYSQTATLVSVDSTTDGTPRTATYRVPSPGGSWDSADNGTYTVTMQTGAVNDTSNNTVAAGSLGSFDVAIPTSGGGAVTPSPASPGPLAPPSGYGAVGSSTGRILYVSTTGNDNNLGTSSTAAFRTASKALSVVRPGETIVFAAGNYPPLTISGKNGTASAPITIKTSGSAVFSSGSYTSGAAVAIRDSSHIILDGVIARRSLFGIMGERITNTTIRNSQVHDIGQEGIHVRYQSSHILIAQNKIHDTGMRGGTYANYGEGVYIGFGAAGGENDGTHHVAVHKNEIFRTSAEAIDMKRGLNNIIAEYNNIHDINTKVRAIINVMDGATGREFGYVVRGNVIRNISGDTYNSDGVGIRIFGGGVDVYNNVISNAEDSGIRNQASRGGAVRIYNNTVFNGGSRGNIVDDTGKADVRNNIGSTKAGNIAPNSSMFVNAAAGDFRLSSGATAAINKGTSLSMVNIDVVGRARPQGGVYDMGAYESQ